MILPWIILGIAAAYACWLAIDFFFLKGRSSWDHPLPSFTVDMTGVEEKVDNHRS